jgi:hypothetical protein
MGVLGRDPVDRAAWLDRIGIVLQQAGSRWLGGEAIAAQRRSYGKPMSVAEAMATA